MTSANNSAMANTLDAFRPSSRASRADTTLDTAVGRLMEESVSVIV